MVSIYVYVHSCYDLFHQLCSCDELWLPDVKLHWKFQLLELSAYVLTLTPTQSHKVWEYWAAKCIVPIEHLTKASEKWEKNNKKQKQPSFYPKQSVSQEKTKLFSGCSFTHFFVHLV